MNTGKQSTYHVTTFGCQMNARDSEKLEGMLQVMGYQPADDESSADIVIFNTCTVRENANERLYGHLGQLSHRKKVNPDLIIGICGCMMQEPTAVREVQEHYPFVDLIFGTFNLHMLPSLLQRVLTSGESVVDIWDSEKEIREDVPSLRHFPYKASVNITYGCNNFCTYCIVPYVRGRERSREMEDILQECRLMVAEGKKEIMLLGQNVDSYGRGLDPEVSFAELLREVAAIPGLERIRFMTNHPKDLTPELVEVMKTHANICRHVHLPLQSGSDDVLKRMNRRYTSSRYLELIDLLRDAMPDIAITTDIIVGFPGETEQDFQDTLDLVEKVGFDSAFTFIYSKRSGTPAAKMEDQVSEEVVKERFPRLLDAVKIGSRKRYESHVGEELDVLVEEENRKIEGYLTGRTQYNSLVHFPGTADEIGTIRKVKITECRGFYYLGE